jgi:hypothetical protein
LSRIWRILGKEMCPLLWKGVAHGEQGSNRVLRKIFGPKIDEVTREWTKLHNEELNDLNSSPSIITTMKSRRMRLVGHVGRMGEKRNTYRLLVGKPGGKRPLGKPKK